MTQIDTNVILSYFISNE